MNFKLKGVAYPHQATPEIDNGEFLFFHQFFCYVTQISDTWYICFHLIFLLVLFSNRRPQGAVQFLLANINRI